MPATLPQLQQILLAQPRGFCAGVERAVEIVERALQLYGPPIYVRHEIVHNRWVVEDLRAKGVIFVQEVDEVPEGGITIFSAHGIAEKVEIAAKNRNLPVINATCPLVTKVHLEAQRYEREGLELILIGHKGHPEVEGTMGRVNVPVHLVDKPEDVAKIEVKDPDKLAYVTQTTLSVDETRTTIAALKARFPNIYGPDLKDICYATQNRQNAVRDMAGDVDAILVVGAKNSSNSNRLRDLGEESGVPSFLINDASELQPVLLAGKARIGITAGASAPEHLVQAVIAQLQAWADGQATLHLLDGVEEKVKFKLPAEVQSAVLREQAS
jgi:4-hydroxy-3-methylbut-2-enyl diphosphate reductase